ncbi:MAG: hypothetical protein Q9220_003499 [cf. Caloplaca sp. 1 TL-2023]
MTPTTLRIHLFPSQCPALPSSTSPPLHLSTAAGHRAFQPPSLYKPGDLFSIKINHCSIPAPRYIRTTRPREALIFIFGYCVDTDVQGNPKPACAGYGIQWSPINKISSRLEGPGPQTSDRAELRAAIVALKLRVWPGEGFHTMVLARESESLMKGVCERSQEWINNGWKDSKGNEVADQDLWEILIAKLRYWDGRGLQVRFWRVRSEWNREAGQLAKEGAEMPPVEGMCEYMAVDGG